MHSVMYRTEVLRKCGMVLPKHTFYVDNIFVYQPLPYVKSMYYMDLDLYRYFIGRADQSVNESIMVKRVDQQLRVTRHMIDCQDLDELKDQRRLHAYMVHYLSVMMAVSDIFLLLDGSDEAKAKRTGLWQYLKDHVSTGVYRAVRYNLGGLTDLKFPGGDKLTLACTASCARSSSSTDSLEFTPSVTSYAVPAPSKREHLAEWNTSPSRQSLPP